MKVNGENPEEDIVINTKNWSEKTLPISSRGEYDEEVERKIDFDIDVLETNPFNEDYRIRDIAQTRNHVASHWKAKYRPLRNQPEKPANHGEP